MNPYLMTVTQIEEEMARECSAAIEEHRLRKRLAHRLALSTASTISRQLTNSDGRTPFQLRLLLVMQEAAPNVFARLWRKMNALVGWRTAPERSHDGMKIEINDQLDAVELKYLEMKKAAIKAKQAGLPPIERKIVRDRIQETIEELQAMQETMLTRPVEHLHAIEM